MTVAAVITPNETEVSSAGELPGGLGEFDPRAVRYEIVGPRAAPVVAVLGGISATKHVTASTSNRITRLVGRCSGSRTGNRYPAVSCSLHRLRDEGKHRRRRHDFRSG